ncbi:hypothetical protein Corgl_1684 [Coriobacterium glomerans PW2]|uniref:Uncharacterized protein n=1 Tax=Coriobacterium glomerans (strain ATCC 49209 / DSM 20642 / JCM 10262 / PW2) TaxID=700015 RepID=F2NB31_CORGP|nr:hypothetical protein Corgl_1684 [Coriobacterium glomerans PW2]
MRRLFVFCEVPTGFSKQGVLSISVLAVYHRDQSFAYPGFGKFDRIETQIGDKSAAEDERRAVIKVLACFTVIRYKRVGTHRHR